MPAYRRGKKWHFRKRVKTPFLGHARLTGSPERYGLPNTKLGAEEAERRAIEEAMNGRPYVAAIAAAGVTLAEFERPYMDTARTKDKISSVEAKRQILRDHLLPVLGEVTVAAINYAVIEDVKIQLSKKLGKKTVNNVLSVLRGMLTLASKRGLIAGVPKFDWLKPPPPTFRFLTFAEVETLVECAADEWKAMLLVAARTGLRISELLALRWDAVDLKAKRIIVRRATVRDIEASPKNNRERAVDLAPSAVAALRDHRHLRGPYVFCDAAGRPLTRQATKNPIANACDAANIPRCGWHTLRHTFASHLAIRGVPLKVIQELMGHATLDMTMRYAHLAPETKAAAVEVLG